MFDRRLVEYFDWGLLGLVLLIGGLGLVMLYSAEAAGVHVMKSVLFKKQMIWFCIGTAAMVMAFIFNYKALDRWGVLFYAVSIILLVCVLFFWEICWRF